MLKRLISILFLASFFAALPAWFLSTLEGWISIDCFRMESANTMECVVSERFAFSSRNLTYTTTAARSLKISQKVRRGENITYQLILLTPSGEVQILRSSIGNSDVIRIATKLNEALKSNAMEFHAEVDPDPFFWVSFSLMILFAGVGASIVFFTPRSEKH
ncbi:hypothetical protein JWG44_00105 [Leptospira sp. 201903071]|uniref:hypothetical protein n=1 Tax=Leptospira ainazelensis TaxID=2810034 RepID=UPI001964A347|nr:hypothetical protein [Leptospira ainazelensis]MBM9498655.1 hypothetical protein [Leptospira ainazelensis]